MKLSQIIVASKKKTAPLGDKSIGGRGLEDRGGGGTPQAETIEAKIISGRTLGGEIIHNSGDGITF